jgi:cell wall integrity and stress response component
MLFTSLRAAVAAVSLLSLVGAQDIPTPTASVALNAMTFQGCFSSADPLIDHGPWTYQSRGNCQPICVLLQMPVMALVNGSNCYCGPELPPANSKVDNGECNTPCNGYPPQSCKNSSFLFHSNEND